jgi:hypothetical protein
VKVHQVRGSNALVPRSRWYSCTAAANEATSPLASNSRRASTSDQYGTVGWNWTVRRSICNKSGSGEEILRDPAEVIPPVGFRPVFPEQIHQPFAGDRLIFRPRSPAVPAPRASEIHAPASHPASPGRCPEAAHEWFLPPPCSAATIRLCWAFLC